jgi:hypothetical protein
MDAKYTGEVILSESSAGENVPDAASVERVMH